MCRTCSLPTAVAIPVLMPGSLAKAQNRDPKTAAKKSLESFIASWNTADDTKLRKTMNFPFVTFGSGRAMRIVEKAEDFSQGFDRMRQRDGWARSSFDFDSFAGITSSAEKVHCEIGFSRYRTNGTKYFTGRVMYFVTNKDGHWRPQLRTAGSPVAPLSVEKRAELLDSARRAALDFMTAFNVDDTEAATRALNYPHLFMISGGAVAIAEDSNHQSVRPNFDRMRSSQNWHVSTFDSLEASIVTENKVHLDVVFSRWHPDGTRYLTIPALWIMTRVGGHWGVQLRSLMPRRYAIELGNCAATELQGASKHRLRLTPRRKRSGEKLYARPQSNLQPEMGGLLGIESIKSSSREFFCTKDGIGDCWAIWDTRGNAVIDYGSGGVGKRWPW